MSQPFMQLYVGDYLRDTQGLTAEGHGAYLLILMALWNADGYLPDDDAKLSRIARCTPARWRQVGPDVMALLARSDGRVTQRRLLRELEKARIKMIKRAHSGSLGGKAKALKDKGADVANATILPWHSPEPEPERRKKKKEPPANAGALAVIVSEPSVFSAPTEMDWLDPEAWKGFCEMRKRKRLPMTDRAKSLILKKLEAFRAQGHDPTAILDASTASSWTDVYEPKEQKIYGNRKPTSHDKFLAAAESLIRDTLEGSGEQDNDPLEQAGYPLLSS